MALNIRIVEQIRFNPYLAFVVVHCEEGGGRTEVDETQQEREREADRYPPDNSHEHKIPQKPRLTTTIICSSLPNHQPPNSSLSH